MRRWPTDKHFTWLTLAPNNKVSGGRLRSSRTPPSANRAAAILRRCAMSLTGTRTALGAFYRRLAVRTGKPKPIISQSRPVTLRSKDPHPSVLFTAEFRSSTDILSGRVGLIQV